MKKFFLVLATSIFTFVSMAQTADNQPTTLYVNLTAQRTTITAGPYARYAQKYLGITAPLADKVLLELVEANINDINELAPSVVADEQPREALHMHPSEGFPKLPIDKTSASPESLEDSARKAANRIFEIRRNRFELITGMAGENVFGGGLKAALKELDRLEQEFLSLFLGRQTSQIVAGRYRVTPQLGLTTYTIAKFSQTDGFLAPDAASGDAILLTLRLLGSASPAGLQLADRPSSRTRTVRIPVDAECRISLTDNQLTSRVLPITQFGRTVYVIQ